MEIVDGVKTYTVDDVDKAITDAMELVEKFKRRNSTRHKSIVITALEKALLYWREDVRVVNSNLSKPA